VAAVFTGGGMAKKGICTDCHVVTDTGSADITKRFAIAPVSINDHYLPQGQFPHGQHKSYDGKTGEAACIACHTGVLKSKASSDVLIPGVANCRECHGAPPKSLLPTAAKAGASCDTCHGFHEGGDGRTGLPAGHGGAAARVSAAVRGPLARRAPSAPRVSFAFNLLEDAPAPSRQRAAPPGLPLRLHCALRRGPPSHDLSR
jgi:hypothetical protein